MYSLSRGPSKIVTSARRGHPRQLDIEGYDNRDKSVKLSKTNGEGEDVTQTAELSNPKPTFQAKKINKWKPQTQISCEPTLQENHLQMAKFLSRQWQQVEQNRGKSKNGELTFDTYIEKGPNTKLAGFTPFDLDVFWGGQTLKSVLGKSSS
ncbi:unnamed protein product [Candidula unifasciata]|uniref:Uncharacterized protein n=1 Tax=Candidula unifasciata TaxID=100452 RepID=A0A8S3ZYG2_9EUPU|nr:unnamed protein product [Candidula unifasciata]